MITVTVKWDKQQFADVVVDTTKTGEDLKQRVYALTSVPADRQKVMCKGGWVGLLKPETKLNTLTSSSVLTLIGSAEKYIDKEVTDTSITAATTATELPKGEGEINAIQFPVGEREDKKKEAYSYSSVVSGYSQTMIENEIKQRKQRQSEQQSDLLSGKIVMHLGLELERSYLTSLICLPEDGTLVSGSENGHLQLWRHAQRLKDVIHAPHSPGLGVASLCTVLPNEYKIAFASGGNQSVKLWTAEGELVHTLNGPYGTTPVADGLVSWRVGDSSFFASGLRSILAPPRRIELAATSRQEAKLVAEADARADAMEEVLGRTRLCVQVWSLSDQGTMAEHMLECAFSPINALAFMNSMLICGDQFGGLHFWKTNGSVSAWTCERRIRLMGPNQAGVTVLCMQPLKNSQILAVSTAEDQPMRFTEHLATLNLPVMGVCLIDVSLGSLLAVIAGHSDSVICMCSLPNGGLVSGGGKKDATVQFWMPTWKDATVVRSSPLVLRDSSFKLKDPGYCLALTVLPDADAQSRVYALAAAKYNAIKIVL